jgi:hypothetical protein
MADHISVVQYFYARVGDRPGEGRRLLEHLSEKGINLMAFTATPVGDGQTELRFITERIEKLQEAASDAGVELHGPKRAFLIQGEDRIGALHDHHLTLANAGINVTSSAGVGSEFGFFVFVVFVEEKDFEKASWAFGFD